MDGARTRQIRMLLLEAADAIELPQKLYLRYPALAEESEP